MSSRPTFHDFVEDELLRAPLALDQVVDAVITQWQRATPAPARLDVDPVRVLSRHRRELVSDAVTELRKQVQAEISGLAPARQVSAGETTRHLELSLIDEDEVASDIEVTRAVEQVKLAAEFELRELQALTSALVDDHNVARDTNPFRPDSYVRSLWRGVHGVPLSRGLQAAFMREAAEPLSRTLRQGYASACSRLEEQGVEPATYRTIVQSITTRGNLDFPGRGMGNLAALRDSLPVPMPRIAADDPPPPVTVQGGLGSASPKVDQQLIELLTRLFDAMHDDPALAAPTVSMLLRLQPPALRVALRDPGMLEAYDHQVWRFMDAMAFMMETLPGTDQEQCLTHCKLLVDHLVADRSANAARFEWASARLAEFDRHLLERSIASAQPLIARLQAAIDSASMPLDVGSLDTIPAALLPDTPPPAATPTDLKAGARLRVYLRGDWRVLQVLWCDAATDVWLLRDVARDWPWALRRRALDRLLAEQLALPLAPRSLVRAAAERVLKAIDPQDDETG